jgi:hypothetical protein
MTAHCDILKHGTWAVSRRNTKDHVPAPFEALRLNGPQLPAVGNCGLGVVTKQIQAANVYTTVGRRPNPCRMIGY